MLQEIIDIQQTAVERLLAALKTSQKEITFKAPTGSGKTYMMADLMNRVLAENPHVVFLVSSLSKGDLARQNYEKFTEYKDKNRFPHLNPYLINSNVAGEERLYIPPEHNVYLLPRDLYKKGGRLMQGAMDAFLMELFVEKHKKFILIKDECHIATKNLDSISDNFFEKTVNFSATPKLARGQHPDVEIRNEEAENAKLIKTISWGSEADTVADALTKFEEVKEDYRNLLGVNPCLIIQISNKHKADEELQNVIMPALHTKPEMKWMLIVDKEKECETNDVFKAKKLPVARWKNYAKSHTATIDVIIFKMVITEGWDIPRACMLYQVRDTQSKQLDEQVMGRVRRNPRLLDFELLSEKAQQLAMTAWVWGVVSDEQKKIYGVKLHDDPQEIIDNVSIKTTKLKPLAQKKDFDITSFMAKQEKVTNHQSIFELGRQLRQAENQVRGIVYDYATDYTKWWEAAECLSELEKANRAYLCDYAQSMEVQAQHVSFALSSYYTDNEKYLRIGNWIWQRRDGVEKFSFDSEAEREWAEILKEIASEAVMPLTVGKIKKSKRGKDVFEQIETDTELHGKEIFLWGKNFVANSSIKFEYYMGSLHSSFPDFVMKDRFGRIHIFEVKSVNQSGAYNFDANIYKGKIAELKNCYRQASKLTGQIFYLPVVKNDVWHITRFYKGEENTLSEDEFKKFVKESP